MVVHQVNKGVVKEWGKEKDFGWDFISYQAHVYLVEGNRDVRDAWSFM